MEDLVRDDTNSLGDRTHKSKSALSRNKMKTDDPERYRIYLDKQRVRAKQRREELKRELQKKKGNEQSKVKKTHQNEMQGRRQKRYMERKKEQGISIQSSTPSTKAKPQTRNIIETRREYNRQKKIKERQEMSWQKKMWIRKKDREKKKKKRKEAAKLKEILSTSTGSPFASKKTEYNITSKVRKSIPKSPTKFAKVVDNLLSKASPRKVKALKRLKISKSTTSVQYARKVLAIKQVLKKSMAPSVIVAEHLVKKYRAGHIAHKKGSIMKRKSHVDRNSIQTFFLREDISRVLPGKRYTSKDGPGYAMQVSLKAAHSKYLAENPTKRVSLGKFSALRTKNVRLLSVSDREFCCCVYCVNVLYKMLCLSRAVVDKDKKKTCETDVLDIVLCPKRDGQRYHDPDCINANCSDCMNYIDTLNQFYRTVPDDKQLTWTRWEYRETEKGKRKRVVVTKQGNKQACLEEFVENDLKRPVQAISYFQHIHTAHWQIAQFNQIKNQLPTCDILQVMDFAKNREIKYQDEIKGAFYTACQITMHPIITFYKADTGLVRNSSIVISEDNGHDYYAVQHFQEIVDIELEEKLGGCKPNRKVIFSDGCSCQYKSKGPFAELADSRDVMNRNYYGSEHGKSECDAETSVVNWCIDRAIVANQTVIDDAEDLYQYCKKNLELELPFSKKTFHLVKLREIDRERPGIMKAQTVQDTRKIHQVLNLQTRNTFKARNLSCFCIKCEAGNPDCLNSKYVNSYKETILVEQTKSSKTQAGDESKKSTSEKPKAGKTRQSEENPKQGKTVKQSEEKPQTGKTRQSEEKPKKGETVKQSEEKTQTGKTRQSEEKPKKGKTVKQSDEKPQTGKTRGRSETSNAENSVSSISVHY